MAKTRKTDTREPESVPEIEHVDMGDCTMEIDRRGELLVTRTLPKMSGGVRHPDATARLEAARKRKAG